MEMIIEWQNHSRCQEAMECSLVPLETGSPDMGDPRSWVLFVSVVTVTIVIRAVPVVPLFHLAPSPGALK